jgi:competence protein ComEA
MARRDTRAAGTSARHAAARLQATIGGPPGLLRGGAGQDFEYRGTLDAGSHCSTGQPAVGHRSDEVPAGHGAAGAGIRWRLGLRVAVLVGLAALVAAGLFWWQAAAGRPGILPLGSATGSPPAKPAGSAPAEPGSAGREEAGEPGEPEDRNQAGTSAPGVVVVHVAGAVTAPGVVRLPAGSRVQDALSAAGGAAADADVNLLNLAQVVQDAQKIHVPVRGEGLPAAAATEGLPGTGSAEARMPGSRTNLNTAGVAELDALPKVGPVLAQRIVDWRKEHGAFTSVEELDAVDGVGPKMLEALLPLVTV